ncbi:MAG: aminotransferase class V-fold PLP-dependent enzyme [Holosporaceae bacterium]|jgi:cysteine desulfurase|nr:aminotransferase class V-fold PLP-dependent enzyme [Holosporaceae bacterium]
MDTQNRQIYMDYQATTPCDKRVLEKMLPYFCEEFGNPHSTSHNMGTRAAAAVECARHKVAKIIGVSDAREIIFTSGATESCNVAIQGASRFYRERGNRIITCVIEHKCMLEACAAMGREGFDVVVLPVLKNGIVDIDALKNALQEKTVLVSIAWVNNEIGVCQPIEEISRLCRERGVLFHSDAAQAVGKVAVDASLVDLMSISGHKIYGPKGIGALYLRLEPRLRLTPLFFGGEQERGIRSGTLPTPLCVGLGEACEIAQLEMPEEHKRLTEFKNYFIKKILDGLEKVYLNGDREKRIPGCLNFSFEGVEGESIMLGMPDVCISSGSACTSKTLEPSHVLKAISIREDLAHSSLRIGLGRFTTFDEVEYVSSKLMEVVNRLREMSPIW